MSGHEAVIEASPALSPTLDSAHALKVEHEKSTPNLPSVVAIDAAQEAVKSGATHSKITEYEIAHEVSTGFAPLHLPDPEAQTTEKSATDSGQLPDKPTQHASSSRESHGIYLRSPALMISCWIFGVIFSLCHHLFYSHFDGSIVGGPNEEQWNIRFVFRLTSYIGLDMN